MIKGITTTTLRSNLLHQLIEKIPTGDQQKTIELQHIDHIKLRQARGRRVAPTVVPTMKENAHKVILTHPSGTYYSPPPPLPPGRSYYREVQKPVPETKDTGSSASKNLHVEPERGSPRELVRPPVPQKTLNVAREEVRDVLLQYTKCADPTEREARLERVRQAEEQGQMEENALMMVRASQNASSAGKSVPPPEDSPERIPATQRLGPDPHYHTDISGILSTHPNSTARERHPATLRLGTATPPIEHTPEATVETLNAGNIGRLPMTLRLGPCLGTCTEGGAPSAPIAGKRKPGRPPGKNKCVDNATLPTGTSTSKRKVLKSKPSPVRRSTIQKIGQTAKASKTNRARTGDNSRAGSTVGLKRPILPALNPRDTVVIRSDAAWASVSNEAGLGWIILSTTGNRSFMKTTKCVVSSLSAEGLALREAVRTCASLGLKKVAFESDSALLIKAVKPESSTTELYSLMVKFENERQRSEYLTNICRAIVHVTVMHSALHLLMLQSIHDKETISTSYIRTHSSIYAKLSTTRNADRPKKPNDLEPLDTYVALSAVTLPPPAPDRCWTVPEGPGLFVSPSHNPTLEPKTSSKLLSLLTHKPALLYSLSFLLILHTMSLSNGTGPVRRLSFSLSSLRSFTPRNSIGIDPVKTRRLVNRVKDPGIEPWRFIFERTRIIKFLSPLNTFSGIADAKFVFPLSTKA
ncbi:hypothetical protein HID58_071743 [Brassica napus]|uniref:RNase H type-1 domain-containing protein n=1 Tax=Brassica napus TaxID=3708 RepID=A0ABQ7Z2G5_BRANA|nr:hypothetical protein HID58_071743 [Brassica napus]